MYIIVDDSPVGYRVVQTEEIEYIKSDGNHLDIVLEKEVVHTYGRLKVLLERLPDHFIRSHRSYIVNMKKAEHIVTDGNRHWFFRYKEILLPISRRVWSELRAEFRF